MAQGVAAGDMASRDMIAEGQQAEGRPEGEHPAEGLSGEGRPTEARPVERRPVEPHPAEGRRHEERTIEVVAIFGPTASGKSAIAEALADRLSTEVVSADAMQVYRDLPILTNQPGRPTRLVGIVGVGEEMSVGAYAPLAHAAIDELVTERGVAVVAGGTGLYLRSALADLDVPPRAPADDRRRIEQEVEADRDAAHGRLARLDAAAADVVHPNDRRRLVRALELAERGRSLVAGQNGLWSTVTRRPTLVIGVDVEPVELERRIRARTREMFRRGVVEEVRAALAQPLSRTAEKTLGLRDIGDAEPDALERVVARTLRYAAYQRKWMRRIPGLVHVDGTEPPTAVAAEIARRIGR